MKDAGGLQALLVAVAVTGAGLLWWGASARRKARAAQAWQTVKAQVIESRPVRVRYGTGRPHFAPRLVYRYELNGHTYQGGRLRLVPQGSFDELEIGAMLVPYPAGATIAVRIDPADPAYSVVEPVAGTRAMSIMGWLLLVAGTGMAALTLVLP